MSFQIRGGITCHPSRLTSHSLQPPMSPVLTMSPVLSMSPVLFDAQLPRMLNQRPLRLKRHPLELKRPGDTDAILGRRMKEGGEEGGRRRIVRDERRVGIVLQRPEMVSATTE